MDRQQTTRHIINWKEYNQALVNRGSLTFWFPEEIKETWYSRHEKKTGRGSFKTYSDEAIQLCLMVKAVYKLPLRALEGFTNSVFHLMRVPLRSPDYSLISKRAGKLQVQIPRRLPEGPVDVVFDSTGLKVYGEGEWKVRAHGASKRRTWLKLHIGANPENGDYSGSGINHRRNGRGRSAPRIRAGSSSRRRVKMRPTGKLDIPATKQWRHVGNPGVKPGRRKSDTTDAALPKPPCIGSSN